MSELEKKTDYVTPLKIDENKEKNSSINIPEDIKSILDEKYWIQKKEVTYDAQKWLWILKEDFLQSNNAEKSQWEAAKKVAETMKEKMDSSPIMEWMILAFVAWIQKFLVDTLKIDQDTVNSLFKWFTKEDRQDKHSVDNLKTYWKTSDSEEWINNWEIEIFRDKDLSTLDPSKMEPFLDKCREKWIDVTKKDFWINVLNNNWQIQWPEIINKDKDWKDLPPIPGKIIEFNEVGAKEVDPPDFKEFYKKLNSAGFIIEEKSKEEIVVSTDEKSKDGSKTSEQVDKNTKIISEMQKLDKQVKEIDTILNLYSANNNEFKNLKTLKLTDIMKNTDDLSLLLIPYIKEYCETEKLTLDQNLIKILPWFKKFLDEKKNQLPIEKETKQKEIVA